MSEAPEFRVGSIGWRDLTVPNAKEVKTFYCDVIGWEASEHDMGEYKDYNIMAPGGQEAVAGICHARGSNKNLPPQWLIYVTVENVAQSADRCARLGGKVVDGPRKMGDLDFCVIQDPAGAVIGIVSKS